MQKMVTYAVRIPIEVKASLPLAARQYGMTPPELVRTVIGLIASGKVALTLTQEGQRHEQPSAAAD